MRRPSSATRPACRATHACIGGAVRGDFQRSKRRAERLWRHGGDRQRRLAQRRCLIQACLAASAGRASTGAAAAPISTRPTDPWRLRRLERRARLGDRPAQLHQPRRQHPPRHPDRHRDAAPRWFAGRRQPTAGVQAGWTFGDGAFRNGPVLEPAVAGRSRWMVSPKATDALDVAGLSRPEVRFADRQRRLADQPCDQRTRDATVCARGLGSASSRMRRRRRSRSLQTLGREPVRVARACPGLGLRDAVAGGAHPCRRFRRRLRRDRHRRPGQRGQRARSSQHVRALNRTGRRRGRFANGVFAAAFTTRRS